MEVEVEANVMASSGATGSISVLLHPLVVMNISEHWTRVRAQEGKAQQGKIFACVMCCYFKYANVFTCLLK